MASWLSIRWTHDFKDDPGLILVEIDDERNELRKIEYFADGRIGVAIEGFDTELTGISDCALPEVDEINADPQFFAEEIEQSVFNSAWDEVVIEC